MALRHLLSDAVAAAQVFVNVMMERMALSGAVAVWLADVIVAALSGAGVLAATCGVYLPLLGYSLPRESGLIAGGVSRGSSRLTLPRDASGPRINRKRAPVPARQQGPTQSSLFRQRTTSSHHAGQCCA